MQAINGLTDEQLNKKVEKGTWSISQILEHLYLAEKVIVRNFTQTQPITEDNPVKMKNVQVVVDRSQKVNAPKFLEPSDEFHTLEQLREKLNSSRLMLVNFLAKVSEKQLDQEFLPHPFLGKLRLRQWIEFLYYHEMRHIEQIKEIREQL